MRIRLGHSALATLVILGLLLGGPDAAAAQGPADWTILVYLDGDNNLEREAINDFIEIAAVGSNARINVLVQLDRLPGYDDRYGDWTGALRFRVTPGMTPDPTNALVDLGEVNMGDPATLSDFYTWGVAAYPAQNIALVLWNHGDGWRTADFLKEPRKAICVDDTNGRDALDMAELGQALALVTANGAYPVDLLAFDACLMAMIEVDAQIQPYVRVRAASEETEPGTGYPFDDILADLAAHPTWTPFELATSIVDNYYAEYQGETMSAVDLGAGYASLIQRVDELAGVLLAHAGAWESSVQSVRSTVQRFYTTDVDLYDLAELLSAAIDNAALDQAAQAVMQAIDAITVHELHGPYWPGANGISIFFPAQASAWDSAYSGENDYLSFTRETRWDEYLIAYLGLAAACTPDGYEPDNSPQEAPLSQADGSAQWHSFCPADDAADWTAFQASAGQEFEIATSNLQTYCDTVLRLYDRDGQTLLVEDDDSGPGWASHILWTSPAAGTYYLEVVDYYGRSGQETGYEATITPKGETCTPDAYEPDDTPQQASSLVADEPPQRHNFCPSGDQADWMTFVGVAGLTYLLQTSHLEPNSDTVVTLYDASGATPLQTDDDGGGEPGASYLRWSCPADGAYTVRIHEKQGRTGAQTGYQIDLSVASTRVEGQVLLQGKSAHDGVQVGILLGEGPDPITTAITGMDGSFAVNTTTPCTVTATFPGYLVTWWTLPAIDEPAISLASTTLLGGDINADREIDILDLSYVAARFGGQEAGADINGDGAVDILDLVLVATNFGQVAQPSG